MKLYIFGFLDFAIFRFLDVLMIGSLAYNVGLAFGTNRVGGRPFKILAEGCILRRTVSGGSSG